MTDSTVDAPATSPMTATASPTAPKGAPNRRERRMAETRAAILSAVRELFDEQGYAETTIEDIAVRADIAPRTFFRYFPSKEAALFAGADDVRAAIIEALAGRPVDEPPLRALLVALDQVAGSVEPLRAELVWAFDVVHQNPEVSIEPATIKARSIAEVAAALAQRMGVDPDADPRPQAWVGAGLAVFGAAMRTMATSDRPVRGVFRELVAAVSGEVADLAAEWSAPDV